VGALERDEFLRATWKVMVAEQVEIEQLVFVDEMGTNTSLSPIYAWAPKGRRAHWSVPRNRGANTTLLSSMSVEGMGPSLSVEGSTTSVVFEAYVQQVLAPTLRRGQVVVMDNLSAHKGERVKELIEGRGCQLIYLPSYSPDLNPIEEAFSKIKRLVRKAEARTKGALIEAIGSALTAVSSGDAHRFFEHCGYRMLRLAPTNATRGRWNWLRLTPLSLRFNPGGG
jgi:transposase